MHARRTPLPACTLLAAALLAGCTRRGPAPPGATDNSTDVAAVRQVLEETQRGVNANDIGFVSVFANDAVIIVPDAPEISGIDAIRKTYADLLAQATLAMAAQPGEIIVMGNYAYERGSYTLKVTDKKSGKVLQDVRNNDIHIFKRQADGAWKTWRLMVNRAS